MDEEKKRMEPIAQSLLNSIRGSPDKKKWKPINIEEQWEWWLHYHRQVNPGVISQDVKYSNQYEITVLDEELEAAKSANKKGSKDHPPIYISRSLEYPSLQALDTLRTSVLQRQARIPSLYGLYRVVKVLGSGAGGLVLGMAMRTSELDLQILDVLYDNAKKTKKDLVRNLEVIFSGAPKVLAVKVSTYRDTTINEFLIARQLALYTLGVGHRFIPAYYSVFEHRGHIDQQISKFEQLTDDSLILGRTRNVQVPLYYTYQQFLSGIQLEKALSTMTIAQANATMCYIHGMLSYLYKQLKFVHCDLHIQNILMIHGQVILPVLNEDGVPITYVLLDYQPVMIDFGISKTKYTAKTTWETFYNTSQIQDILYLNRNVLLPPNIDRKTYISYAITKKLIAKDLNLDEAKHVPPFMEYLAEGTLTHARIVQEILSSGSIDNYITTDPPEPVIQTNMELYTGRDDVPKADILKKAKKTYDAYLVLPAAKKNNDLYNVVELYLGEVSGYYSKM
jgi:hypothetical protein